MKRTEQPLSELAKAMTAVPQVLLNVKVSKKPNLASIPDLQQAISESERRFNGSGRVLVRYSGTEPLLRIMAGSLMRQGKINLCIVGADRIAANGDVANKIGTYSVAVLAKAPALQCVKIV